MSDNREASAATLPQHTENAVRLLHMVQDFLQAEGLVSPALWTEKVLEETVTLMDSLMVWYSAGTQWFQLSQVGLRLLLGFMAQEDPEVSYFSHRSPFLLCLHCPVYIFLRLLVKSDLCPRCVPWPLPSSTASCRRRRCPARTRPATCSVRWRASCGAPSRSKPRRRTPSWFLCCARCSPKSTASSTWSCTSPNSPTPTAARPSLRTSSCTATHLSGASTSTNMYEIELYSVFQITLDANLL